MLTSQKRRTSGKKSLLPPEKKRGGKSFYPSTRKKRKGALKKGKKKDFHLSQRGEKGERARITLSGKTPDHRHSFLILEKKGDGVSRRKRFRKKSYICFQRKGSLALSAWIGEPNT